MTSQIELAFSHRALSQSPSNPFPFQAVAFVVFAFVFVFVNSCHHVLPLFKLDPSVLFRVSSIILGTICYRLYISFFYLYHEQVHLLLEVSEWTECYVFR